MIRIKQLYRLNKDVSYTGIWENYPHLLFAAVHYFQNWGEAVRACGIDHNKVRRQKVWSKKRIKEELMRILKMKEEMSYNEFERRHPELFHAALYHFGSWENAISAIGMDYEKTRKANSWSREKILKTIRELQSKGVDLSYRAMYKNGDGPVVSASNFFFGSWREALLKTGIDYNGIRRREKRSKPIAGEPLTKSGGGGRIVKNENLLNSDLK
ncbi:hypothetical protein KAW50_08820 [candidate division WOR-3 bacterium]|nr:hypothetical protein [candidate division WOR-3 bacterium]